MGKIEDRAYIPTAAEQKTAARLMAVQNIYSREILDEKDIILDLDDEHNEGLVAFYRDVIRNESLASEEDLKKKSPRIKINRKFLKELTENVADKLSHIDENIDKLENSSSNNKLGVILQSILRAASYELIYNLDTPTNVIINEYVTVSGFFLEQKEINYVNALLDKLSKNIRK